MELLTSTVISPISGLSFTSTQVSSDTITVRIYGTPTEAGTYYLYVTSYSNAEDEPYYQDFYVSVTTQIYGDWGYYLDSDGNATIISYSGAGGSVQVPQTLGDITVTGINASTFLGNTTITALVIPPSVSKIEEGAFTGTSIIEVLNFSSVAITENSYGLDGATIYTSIDSLLYLSNANYSVGVNDDSAISIMIRLIPLAFLLGLILFVFYRIRDRDNYE